MTHRVCPPRLPVAHLLDHPSMGPEGSLEDRVAGELAKGRSAIGCVPLLLQQEAARTIQALSDTLVGMSDGALPPDAALARAQAALEAWNAQVGTAQALLQADTPRRPKPWWRFW